MAKITTFRIEGVDNVIKEINDSIKNKVSNMSNKGFIRVGILLRQSMENNTPLIPVDTGNLRASWFTVSKGINGAVHKEGIGYDAGIKVKAALKQAQAAVVAKSAVIVAQTTHPIMIFGFAANYAVPVHEEKRDVKWKRPGSGPKYFQKALEREKMKIIQILAQSAKK